MQSSAKKPLRFLFGQRQPNSAIYQISDILLIVFFLQVFQLERMAREKDNSIQLGALKYMVPVSV